MVIRAEKLPLTLVFQNADGIFHQADHRIQVFEWLYLSSVKLKRKMNERTVVHSFKRYIQ